MAAAQGDLSRPSITGPGYRSKESAEQKHKIAHMHSPLGAHDHADFERLIHDGISVILFHPAGKTVYHLS
jgi:hypothetical protein